MSKNIYPHWTRRALLRSGSLAVGGFALGARLARGQATTPVLPPHILDLSGNALLGPVDLDIVRRGQGGRRGFGLEPAPGFDYRADVFGRGRVDGLDVQTVTANLAGLPPASPYSPRRPITVAWHYGWYNGKGRDSLRQMSRFLAGNYASDDPVTEGAFNRLKNEFGITVDALSWITPVVNRRVQSNYRAGYMKAPDLATRHVALLYESTISLPGRGRKDFADTLVRGRLVADFGRMGRFFAELRDTTKARIFKLDGRPVMFIFGSHTWGLGPGFGFEFDAMDVAIDNARETFARAYGKPPYLVGEEQLFSSLDGFGIDRIRRIASFDAVFSYHHASSQVNVERGNGLLQHGYAVNNRQLLELNIALISRLLNRYTLRPVLVIPSLAPGFAKLGFRSLLATKGDYADFMKLTSRYYLDNYLLPTWGNVLGTPQLPAPVYTLGSWNEEFEGHAVFPAAFNRALLATRLGGFDVAMAVKQLFSWNHYARRSIT